MPAGCHADENGFTCWRCHSVRIGILAGEEDGDEIVRRLPDEHDILRLELGSDGFETSTAYACSLVIISLVAFPLPIAFRMAKRMREVAMTVVYTNPPANADADQLLRYANYVVDGSGPALWRHACNAVKHGAAPRVMTDADLGRARRETLVSSGEDSLSGESRASV